MQHLPDRPIVFGALVATLLAAEIIARLLGPTLPDPSPWPSLESEVKATLVGQAAGSGGLVLVGDSTMESGVDPARLRVRHRLEAFNAAIPFSTPLSMEPWLTDLVMPALRPRTVVIGLGFDPPQTTTESDPLRGALLRSSDSGVWALLERGSELVRRRRQFREWPETLRAIQALRAHTWRSDGFQTGYLQGRIHAVANVDDPASAAGSPMSSENVAALGRIVRRLEEGGVEVAIVMEPVRCETERCRRLLVESEFHRQVRRLAADWGVAFLDVNDERWSPDLFVDGLHLTAPGVERFTDLVGAFLSSKAAEGA